MIRNEFGGIENEPADYLIHFFRELRKYDVHLHKRIMAKFIDFLLLYLPLLNLNNYLNFSFEYSFVYLLFITLIGVTITNAYLETKSGQSIGKKIFGLRVVDDWANTPNIKLSIKRNLLAICIPLFINNFKELGVGVYFRGGMDFNFNLSQTYTYIVTSKRLSEIRQFQIDDDSDEWVSI